MSTEEALQQFKEAHNRLLREALKLPLLEGFRLFMQGRDAETDNEEEVLSGLSPDLAVYFRKQGWGRKKE